MPYKVLRAIKFKITRKVLRGHYDAMRDHFKVLRGHYTKLSCHSKVVRGHYTVGKCFLVVSRGNSLLKTIREVRRGCYNALRDHDEILR